MKSVVLAIAGESIVRIIPTEFTMKTPILALRSVLVILVCSIAGCAGGSSQPVKPKPGPVSPPSLTASPMDEAESPDPTSPDVVMPTPAPGDTGPERKIKALIEDPVFSWEQTQAKAQAIAAFGSDAIPTIVESLSSQQPGERRIALAALERLGPVAASTVKDIEPLLKDHETDDYAVKAISSIDPELKESREKILGLLVHEHPLMIKVAATALIVAKVNLEEVLRVIEPHSGSYPSSSRNDYIRDQSARVIASSGPSARLRLLELVRQTEKEMLREIALLALAEIGPSAESDQEVAQTLVEVWHTDRDAIDYHFDKALHRAVPAKDLIPLIVPYLSQASEAYLAMTVIQESGPPAKDAVPELVALLEGLYDNPTTALDLRSQSLTALASIGAMESAAPRLSQALAATSPADLRRHIPSTIYFLYNPDKRNSYIVFTADPKAEYTSKHLVPALAQTIQDSNPDIRHWSTMALAEIGPAAEPTKATIVENLRTRRVRWAECVVALANMGKPAIPVAIELMQDRDEDVRAWGAGVLSMMKDPEAKREAKKQLEQAIREKRVDPDLCKRALAELNPE